jgi:hypothetical protein
MDSVNPSAVADTSHCDCAAAVDAAATSKAGRDGAARRGCLNHSGTEDDAVGTGSSCD